MSLARAAALCVLVETGCVSTMPPFVGESTEVLGRHEVGLVAAGGVGALGGVGGGSSGGQVAGAGEARLRYGIGAKQEVGVTGFGGVGSTSGTNAAVPYEVGGKLSYKVAPLTSLAFVASGGAFDESQTAAVAGDLAAIVAPYTDRAGNQFYLGAKGAFAIPIFQHARGATEALIVPVGFALRSSESVRVFLEGGAIVGFSQFYDDPALPASSGTSLGGYGVVAVGVVLH